MNLIDYGNDFNKDKHCDLDGWFVDKDGFHVPVALSPEDKRNVLLKKTKYYTFSIPGKYRSYGYNTSIDVSVFKEYSENDPNNIFSSPNINKQLRSGQIDYNVRERIYQLDAVMNKFVFGEKIQVYRGMGIDINEKHLSRYVHLREGDVITEKSFTSTSYSFERACFYATQKNKFCTIVFEIDIYPGVKGVPLFVKNGSAGSGFEHEIVLERDLRFKVLKRSYKILDDANGVIMFYKLRTI